MSVWQVCQREVTTAYSCSSVAVKIRNACGRVVKSLDPIRFGDERRYSVVVIEPRKAAPSDSSSTPSSCSLNSPLRGGLAGARLRLLWSNLETALGQRLFAFEKLEY